MKCVGCGFTFLRTDVQHHSEIFGATCDMLLCESCFSYEDAAIERNGSNDIPNLLRFYKGSLE